MVWLAASDNAPRARPARSSSTASAAATRVRMLFASIRKALPAAVSTIPRPIRSNSLVWYCASRAATDADVADCVQLRSRAACVTCSRAATATKILICSSVIVPRSCHQLDQHQAEARDEQEGGQAEQQRPQAFCFQLGEVGLQSHGGERHR